MNILKNWTNKLRAGFINIVFPNVCLGCGEQVLEQGQHICLFCLHRRFETALTKNSPSSAGLILPQGVVLQQALWNFDKDGTLQNLLHHLKYQQLTDVGVQLGAVFAKRLKNHGKTRTILADGNAILIPVPLHYLKFRKRGFNQAFSISRGIRDILSIPICSVKTVVRTKNTISQTGLSLKNRQENVKNVFLVKKKAEVSGKVVIIVDDVFTTGATSFELAKTLSRAGADSVVIWTIAQA